ncbi:MULTISPECIES: sensor histidine kinase [Comamonas]|uniref:histidine kinase n=1 Tax=Comamonas terrigena TaxID=32013 RepID=A0A2A7UWE1_COMTR|nr:MULTISPECIES: ATP-binding protein [Comamonas]MBD9531462.1 hypothetical protein [Comamonas sp. CMM01]PEH89635.1 hypothetical protein CRM82_14445 [Comamonas terrigena]
MPRRHQRRSQRHPAWMLGAGTALWLLEIAAILYWHLGAASPDALYEWQNWAVIVVLHLLTATWFGLMWPKVLRWRRRSSLRVSPEVRAERERIAQDLHDGAGSHLSGALALLETPQPNLAQVRHAVEHAMFALRVEMEALDDADASLIERLASMRWRLQPLLSERGMVMQWNMPMDEADTSPRAEKGLQLAFLAQEAMSNALQHSKGTSLRVELQPVPVGSWTLEVADDGCGMEDAPVPRAGRSQSGRGWGVDGMRARAQRIGAQFALESSPGRGTCVRVVVPADAIS